MSLNCQRPSIDSNLKMSDRQYVGIIGTGTADRLDEGHDSLEQVLVERVAGREDGETVGHQKPTPLRVGLVVVLPGLVTQLAEDLVPQLLIGQSLCDVTLGY